MQNRTFLVLLRPIFWEKLKIAPPHRKTAPPQTFEFPNLAEKSVSISVKTFIFFWRPPYFGRKKALNFGFRPKNQSQFRWRPFLFFLETTIFWAEKTFEFPSFPRNFVSIFGQTVWKWFKNNENSGQGRLHFSHTFKLAPPFSKSWLRACMVQYLAKFMPNLVTDLKPLRNLTRKNVPWVWSKDCDNAVLTIKRKISTPLLVYFDETKPLMLQVDSSKSGLKLCCYKMESL